jgi:hypothetical protein
LVNAALQQGFQIDPLANDSAPRKMANRVYNAARWGPQAATASEMAAVSLPRQRGANEAKYKDGFGEMIELIPRGERIDSTEPGEADSCSTRSFFE